MYKFGLTLSLSMWILVQAASSAAQTPMPRLLLQDIQPKGIDEQVARSLTDLLEMEIEHGRLFEVVSQQDLRKLLQVEEQRLLYGLEEGQEERMAAIARKVNAPYALATSVGRVGQAYVLSLRLLDVEQSKVIRRVNQTLVGEETGLVGSLRAAVLSLTLEEKGVAPDISAGLINDLTIAEKSKTAFFGLSAAYEVPMGYQASADDILVMRPSFPNVRLDVEVPIYKWIRLFASTAIGTTIYEEVYNSSGDILFVDRTTGPDEIYLWQASSLTEEYKAIRIPFQVGVVLTPRKGRFLPFLKLGAGLSYQKYMLTKASLHMTREQTTSGCPELFNELVDPAGSYCELRQDMTPESNISELGLELAAGAGMEWLVTQHIGFKAEVRYQYTFLFASTTDLRRKMTFEKQLTDGSTITLGKLVAIQPRIHSLDFSTGLVVYW